MATTADSLALQADKAYTDAQTLAANSLAESNAALAKAQQSVQWAGIVGADYVPNPADVTPTPITKPILPTNDFSVDVKNAFDYAFGSFNSAIQPQIVNYLATFFPDIAATLKSGSDQWLIDTIANGRFVPANVEAAIWNRAKDREVLEAARVEKEVIDGNAARGFATPPGTINASILGTREELAKKLTSINRDMAIKSFDVANENTKFAIQQSVSLRTAFVSAMGDFIKTAMHMPNNATDYAKVVLQAKTGLYDSAIRLYTAQIEEERTRAATLHQNTAQDIAAQAHNVASYAKYFDTKIQGVKVQADVAIAAADQLARVAAAAMATRNSVVSVSAAV